jgi:peptidoglycan/xylan/chitin deacetylase (PgdA/CDA1 family)
MDWAANRLKPAEAMPLHALPGDQSTIRGLTRNLGITFGAHTWGHPNLATLPESEVVAELCESRDWLRAQGVRYLDWIAYPYGLTNSVVTAAAADGFRGALMIRGGLAQASGRYRSAYALPRVNVPRRLTLDGLQLRLAGLLS